MAKTKKTEIEKTGSLGGRVTEIRVKDLDKAEFRTIDVSDGRDYSSEAIKAELKEKGLSATENITVKNDVTGKETSLTIQRDGTPDSKLVIALADPNLTRDQKDHVMSMYLYERGKESSSFIVDIMRYKGQHTKETRAFTSQMRFDFELFVSMFTEYLEGTSKSIFSELWYDEEEIKELETGYIAFVKRQRETGLASRLVDYFIEVGGIMNNEKCALLQQALHMRAEATILRATTKRISEARMKEKGYGIYLGTDGRPYSMFGNDKEVEDAVAKDRERIEELKKEML